MQDIMQDRYKFKIWDKTKKKFLPLDYKTENTDSWISIDNTGVYLVERDNARDVAFFTDITEDVIILQCTGLSDKNGKEIYDGDILNLYVSSKKLYRYQVKYEIGSFMLVSQDEIFDFKNVWNDNVYPLSQLYFEYQNEENCIDQCEVVGNIYENPELLEIGVLA